MKRRVLNDATLPTVPADLLRCVVEDWVTPSEMALARRRPLPMGEVDADAYARFILALQAWRAWQDFRADWLAEHEVLRRDACRVWPLSPGRRGARRVGSGFRPAGAA